MSTFVSCYLCYFEICFFRYKCGYTCFLHFSGFSDLCREVGNGLCSLGRWVPPLWLVTPVPGDQPCRGTQCAMWLQMCKIPVLSPQPDAAGSIAVMRGSVVSWGNPAFSFAALPSWQWQPMDLCGVHHAPPPEPEISHRVSLSLRENVILSTSS